jgi:dihydrofolate reductase
MIAALTRDLVIANQGRIPWHIPHDLKRFRELTLGKPVIMGRRTYESIGRPLEGRDTIVLTNGFSVPSDVERLWPTHSVNAALDLAEQLRGVDNEVMIAGGAEVYTAFMPLAERLYLSVVEPHYAGDTFFPGFLPEGSNWGVTRQEYCSGEGVSVPYTFIQMGRGEARQGSLRLFLAKALSV